MPPYGAVEASCLIYDPLIGPSVAICLEFRGTVSTSILQTACSSPEVLMLGSGCPTEMRVGGGCLESCDLPSVRIEYRYYGTPADAQAHCANICGATYLP
jgi:hypothetical protein